MEPYLKHGPTNSSNKTDGARAGGWVKSGGEAEADTDISISCSRYTVAERARRDPSYSSSNSAAQKQTCDLRASGRSAPQPQTTAALKQRQDHSKKFLG